ncbi:MAG: hypothetical protein P8Q35_04805 [Candidatus Thalassarchaeaceae archaeon]|nr:hypothetical protein [Candidatus Thalassarchaeaceae archaeon]MDP6147750.1 hypothetical protein [Candidatus Thalassarchaeaceae archaeon]HJO41829.1 hypothetical protein [Candidatus Thalassarchaeaceae archaeon]|tara:strand:- start:89 stop:412 length:324 start_codon:yes stop_codon:yes gene_type:complete
MGWWPFKRTSRPIIDDLHIRGTRIWIQDLREVCERNFDNHSEGQRMVRQMQIEWTDAHAEGEVDEALLNGLNRRTIRLLRADADEWLQWLDNDDFWKPGWRDEPHED